MFKRNCISAASWGPNRIDVFGLGTDSKMYHLYFDGVAEVWGPSIGPELLFGHSIFTSAPTAVSWGPNRLDVFGLGTDNKVYHLFYDGVAQVWGPSIGPEVLPGDQTFSSAPAAVCQGPKSVDVFAIGTDKKMYHKYWNAASGVWEPLTTWEPLGGAFIDSPAAVSWGPDRLDVFGLGTDNKVYHMFQDGDAKAWEPAIGPEVLPGDQTFKSAPAVVSWGPNRIDVFAVGTDNQMYHKYWDGVSGIWEPQAQWEPMGGTFNSAPRAVSWGSGRIDIFALGVDNQALHKAWYPIPPTFEPWVPSPTTWEPLQGNFHSAPAAVSWGSNRVDVLALGDDNALWHTYGSAAYGVWQPPKTNVTIGGWGGPFGNGTFKVFTTPTNYKLFPIVWGELFPPGVEKNWSGLTPYTGQQFFSSLTALFSTSYFSDLDQYGVPLVTLAPLTAPSDPVPAGQGIYTAVFTVDDVVNLLRNNLGKALPTPSQVSQATPVYLVVLPSGSTIDVSGAAGAHYFFPFPSPSETSTGSELVIWAWAYASANLNAVMMETTHETVEAIGADSSAPRELSDGCLDTNPSGAPGPGGVTVSTYFDAANNRCVAPPNFP